VHVPINASVRLISLWWWDTLVLDLVVLQLATQETTMAQSGEAPKPNFCQRFSAQCSSFGKFLYNGETGEVMGRSGNSWAKIGFFYLVFYGFLAGFFSAMLAVFMTTIEKPEDGGRPKLTQFIANKPGITTLGKLSLLDGYDANSTTSDYAEGIQKYFEEMKNNSLYKGECPIGRNETFEKPCYAPSSIYGDCAPEADLSTSMFGVKDEKPCVFIRINRVREWVPEEAGKYLKLECSGTGFSKQWPEGFLMNGFPYMGGNYELPWVAVQLDATVKGLKVRCELKGKGISVSDSFNTARSYGKIQITDVSVKN